MGSGASVASTIVMNSCLTKAQQRLYQNSDVVKNIIYNSRTIAIVGLSADRQKASYFVASYLKSAGYRVIPVNPRIQSVLGERCYPDLLSIPHPVDLVDIFRPAADCLSIVQQAVACKAGAVWLQLKIANNEAAELAAAAGLKVVMDLCIKMEHGRYSGGLHEAGMNTGIISARRIHRFI